MKVTLNKDKLFKFCRSEYYYRFMKLNACLRLRQSLASSRIGSDPLFNASIADGCISDGSLLKDKNLASMLKGVQLGYWALDAEWIEVLVEEIRTRRPQAVLEFGSGVSTIILSHVMQSMHGRSDKRPLVFSVEQSPEVMTETRENLKRHGLLDGVRLLCAPLVSQVIRDLRADCYRLRGDELRSFFGDIKPDFVLIDGPSGGYGCRFGTIPLVRAHLEKEAVVLMDDALRDSELAIADWWERLGYLDAAGIKWIGKGMLMGVLRADSYKGSFSSHHSTEQRELNTLMKTGYPGGQGGKDWIADAEKHDQLEWLFNMAATPGSEGGFVLNPPGIPLVKSSMARNPSVDLSAKVDKEGSQWIVSSSANDNRAIRVSVIIPTYNRSKLIERAVRSVQAQSYPVLEIIIVDDASDDDTESMVRKMQLGDPRIIYCRHERNLKAQAARNTGLRKASGEWIAFLDSDDEWLPARIEEGLMEAHRWCTSVVHCECLVQRSGDGSRSLFGVPPYRGRVYDQLLTHPGPVFPGLLVRRECFETIGLLDEAVPSYQEWDTAICLARHYDFAFVSEPLFVYHLHEGEAISKHPVRDADGWAYVVEKHSQEMVRLERGAVLARHYEILIHKYLASGMDSMAALYGQKLRLLKAGAGGNHPAGQVEAAPHPRVPSTEQSLAERAIHCCRQANRFVVKGDFASALHLLDEAMYLNSNIKYLHYARGVCLKKLGCLPEAIAAFNAELGLNPHDARSLKSLREITSIQ
jgi:predicted O-methyltransferase YrrM